MTASLARAAHAPRTISVRQRGARLKRLRQGRLRQGHLWRGRLRCGTSPETGREVGRKMIRLVVGWKASLPHIIAKFRDGAANGFADIHVSPREFRSVALRHADRIMQNENLSVTIRACADANRRNAHLLGDARGKFARHRLENDRESAGGLNRMRVTVIAPPRFACGPAP